MGSLHARLAAAERLAGKQGVSVAAVRKALTASYESNAVPRSEALQEIVSRIRSFLIAANLMTHTRTAEELRQSLSFTLTPEEAAAVDAALLRKSEEADMRGCQDN